VWAAVFLSLLLLSPAEDVAAQCLPYYTVAGEADSDELGYSVAGAGDVNRDGVPDFIVGAYRHDFAGPDAGRAYVFSGQDGTNIYTFDGVSAGDLFGYSVAGAGDVDNDGWDDIVIGAYRNDAAGVDAGRAYVLSGQTGLVIWTLTGLTAGDFFGHAVAGAGDVNGDNFDDVIVGVYASDAGGSATGQATVFSGQTGLALYTLNGEVVGDQFGWSVAGAGDVNNDGFTDVIVGADRNDAGGADAGRAYVYSGPTGTILHTLTGLAPGEQFGHDVAGARRVNADLFDDLIVGAFSNDAVINNAGRAYVFSGATGALLHTFTGESGGDFLGISVAGAGDVDLDGRDDLLVGAHSNNAGGSSAGRVYVFSGLSGAGLYTITAQAAEDQLGVSVDGIGDVNGDGAPDIVLGAYRNDLGGFDAGAAYVYTECCDCPWHGNCSFGGFIDATDLAVTVDIVFFGLGCPLAINCPVCCADFNCDCSVDAVDLALLIDHVFFGGPGPCNPCGIVPPLHCP